MTLEPTKVQFAGEILMVAGICADTLLLIAAGGFLLIGGMALELNILLNNQKRHKGTH